MNITGDYHTHTRYSKFRHGKHTISDMVKRAEELGLKGYAISDHGPKHALFGIRRKNIDKAKAELEALKEVSNINLYFGIEANLMKRDGSIDLTDQEIAKLDLLIVGYHRGCKNDFVSAFRNKEKQKQINTEAYLNLLDKYKVDIISHLNEYIKVDVYKVACKAKEKGTIIELNNKHIKFTEEEAKALVDSGVTLILSSDAHRKQNIAKLDKVLDFVEKYNIPHERIANIDKIYK